MRSRAKRTVSLAVGVTLGIPLIAWSGWAAYVLAAPWLDSYRHSVRFDSEQWKARSVDAGIWWPTRLRMADDLVRRRLLDGRSRREVQEMLGPRDDTAKFSDWNLVYHLGPERALFSVDSEWLVIRLGPADVVEEYRLVSD